MDTGEEVRVDRGVFLKRVILGHEGLHNALSAVYELKMRITFGVWGCWVVFWGVEVVFKGVVVALWGSWRRWGVLRVLGGLLCGVGVILGYNHSC